MDSEITSSAMQRLLGIGKVALNELAKDGIAVRGAKHGTFKLETITRYVQHLREQAAGRGSAAGADARAKLGEAQADLATTKAALLRGELVEVAEVEKNGGVSRHPVSGAGRC
jgi:phage terminase Nu1 subunit (DNA packaging protein)